jgi:hypothetical protein
MGVSGGSSNQESSSNSYGYNQSLAQSMQSIWAPQASALTGMYGGATALQKQQQQQVPGAARRLGAQVQPAGQFGLDQMTQFANPNSGLARRQTADLADTVGTEFGRSILPQITSGAGLGGNIGGSREALAKGVAGGDAARAISSGATDFFSNAYSTAASAASQLPGMAANVFNLGMQPFQAAWAPMSALAGILGGPTTLNRSQALNQSENWAQAQSQGASKQFGFSLW